MIKITRPDVPEVPGVPDLRAVIGALFSGVLLAGHALYFKSASVALADGLAYVLIVSCWIYLLKQKKSQHEESPKGSAKGSDSKDKTAPSPTPAANHAAASSDDLMFIQQSNAFHVQLGTEMSDQLVSAHTELGNTQAILSDAIVKLVSNFIAISDGVRDLSEHTSSFSKQVREKIGTVRSTLDASQHVAESGAAGTHSPALKSDQQVKAMLEGFVAFNETVTQNAIELNVLNTKVEQNVLVVISSLQFQDMSSQLIDHARMRMSALQEIANEMGRGGDFSSHRAYLEQIAAYNRILQKHIMSLDKKKANPVAQKNFGTGDIELF